jgi:hypothetical protein
VSFGVKVVFVVAVSITESIAGETTGGLGLAIKLIVMEYVAELRLSLTVTTYTYEFLIVASRETPAGRAKTILPSVVMSK